MTPFCIFPIDTGDKRCPLGNIAWLTLQSALKGWKFINELGWIQNRMGKMRKYQRLPWYDCASSSRNEVPWMGISCVSQVQFPWGRLPGNGQVFPEKLLSAHLTDMKKS